MSSPCNEAGGLKTNKKMKTEEKKAHWKKVKVSFMKNIPNRFKVEAEGIEDDSEYYHPEIILDDDLKVRGQCDLEHDYVYGMDIKLKRKLAIGGYLYELAIPCDFDEHLSYLLNNYEKIKQQLMDAFVEVEKIHHLKESLDTVQKNILQGALEKEIDKTKLKQSIAELYDVSEYLENKRIAL